MNPELIKKISEEIVNQTIIHNLSTYLIIIVISVVFSSLSAFYISYLRKRGETLATKADFDKILQQLESTTRISEEIKTNINAKSQEELDLKSLLREKLELIMSETFMLELWLEKVRSRALDKGEMPNINESPIAKIDMYQSIYFSQVEEECLFLKSAQNKMVILILSVAKNHKDPNTRVGLGGFEKLQESFQSSISAFRSALIKNHASNVGL